MLTTAPSSDKLDQIHHKMINSEMFLLFQYCYCQLINQLRLLLSTKSQFMFSRTNSLQKQIRKETFLDFLNFFQNKEFSHHSGIHLINQDGLVTLKQCETILTSQWNTFNKQGGFSNIIRTIIIY